MLFANDLNGFATFSFLLQVLYLDSIDIGILNLEHNTVPRIMFFGAESMKSMILADTVDDDISGIQYGKSQVSVLEAREWKL